MWRKTKLKGLIWNFEEVGARFKEREEVIGAKLVVHLEHASPHRIGNTEIF